MRHELLYKLHACADGAAYAEKYKSLKTAWCRCQRGDWMLWLAKKLHINRRELVGAAGECAATAKHLMKDHRSIAALDACEVYSQYKITDGELADAAYDAAAAANDAAYAAADAAADAAAGAAANDAAYAAYAAAAYDTAAAYAAAAAAAAAARKASQQQTADICRKRLTNLVYAALDAAKEEV